MNDMSQMNNGDANVMKGGILLGSRKRTVFLSPADDQRLEVMAKVNGIGASDMLSHVVSQGINVGWGQMMMGKMLSVLVTWVAWA